MYDVPLTHFDAAPAPLANAGNYKGMRSYVKGKSTGRTALYFTRSLLDAFYGDLYIPKPAFLKQVNSHRTSPQYHTYGECRKY
jgi:hypothetical protein